MKPFPSKELLYFVGKACSVFTTQSNRDLRFEDSKNYPASLFRYFVGIIEVIDEHGIFLTQSTKGLKVFIMKDHVIAIAEEEMFDPNNPKDAEEIKRMEELVKKTAEAKLEAAKIASLPKSGQFINPEAMKKFAGDLNKNFGSQQP